MIIRLLIEIQRGNILTYNYQYPLSAFIYKTLAKADADFATFLHEEGYKLNNKKFKHFTFSALNFGKGGIKPIPKSDRFYINTREISLQLRFFVPKAAETFVVGLFSQQEFSLGDKLNKIDCYIKNVETLKSHDFTDGTCAFTTNSPILLSVPRAERPSRYLHPKHDADVYAQLFIENLQNKWLSLGKDLPAGNVDFSLIGSDVKKQGIKIKAYTNEETQIIPYKYSFMLNAPKELLQLGYLAGFGLENSMGLGCCEKLEKN